MGLNHYGRPCPRLKLTHGTTGYLLKLVTESDLGLILMLMFMFIRR